MKKKRTTTKTFGEKCFGYDIKNQKYVIYICTFEPLLFLLGVLNGQVSQCAVYWIENSLGLGSQRFGCGAKTFTYEKQKENNLIWINYALETEQSVT